MSAYIVSYDLHKRGQNYECIIEKLKGYPEHWHMQQSVWIISTNQTVVQIRDHLMSCLDENDNLFVGKLSAAAWHGFAPAAEPWLKARIV